MPTTPRALPRFVSRQAQKALGLVTAGLNEKTGVIEENEHTCVYCGHEFSRARDLRRHVMIHTGETPFNCFYCDKAFNRRERLKDHCLREHEMTEEEFQAKATFAPRGRPKKKSKQ